MTSGRSQRPGKQLPNTLQSSRNIDFGLYEIVAVQSSLQESKMRKLLFVFIFISVFLPGCNFLPPLRADPSQAIVFKPSATPTIVPPPTSTEIAPTVSPVPTIDPNFYRDDFNGNIAAPWIWVRENSKNWSLANIPGALQISVSQGYVSSHTNTNMLLRPAPAGNFQIETQMTFSPQDNFQFAGLIIYESDSNFIQAGREYCRAVNCIGEGLYMNYYKKGVIIQPDFGQPYREIDPILLRLSRRANIYIFEASTDGKVWFIIGSHMSELNPLQIGLVTGQRLKGNPISASFDYFEVRSLP
jgi:beta-xylosidase